MIRKIKGTNKFEVYIFNGKNVRGKKIAKSRHFLYKQWGRVWELDEDGKKIGNGYPFMDYGEMLHFINKIMSKSTRKNIKD